MHSGNKVFNNTIFLYIKMFITVFSSLYTTRLILDALGVEDFGIFNLVMGLISMLMFFNSAMTDASQRFMSFAKGRNDLIQENNIFNISVILHFFVGIFLIIFLYLIEPLLFDYLLKIDITRIETAETIYKLMIINAFFAIISVPYDAIINARENMLFVAILGIFESLLKLLIALFITYFSNDKLLVYGELMALITIILMFVKAFYCHFKYEEVKIVSIKYLDMETLKKMLNYAGYTFLGSSTQMLTNYGQGIVMNVFFGTVVNAAQGIVTQVSGQLAAFAMTMLKALNPMIVKSEGAGNRKLMIKASFMGSKLSFYLLIIFYVPVLIEMETIFDYWLVQIPQYTIIFCKLLLIRNLIEQLYITLYSSIASVGNIKQFQIYNTILNLLPLPIGYILFHFGFEPWYMYIIFIVYSITQGIIYVYYAKKECQMSIKEYFEEVILKSLIPFFIVFMVSLIPSYFIESKLIELFVVGFVSTISFFVVIWIYGLGIDEKTFILQKVNVLKQKVRG